MSAERERLRQLVAGCVKRGEFVLASGRKSDFYFDGKEVLLTPEGSYLAAKVILRELLDPRVTAVGGLTAGADPLVSAIGVLAWLERRPLKLFYVRKEPKKHGTRKFVEGPPLGPDDAVAIVDDVVTTGESIRQAAARVAEEARARIVQIVALVDRQEGGREALEHAGLAPFAAVFTREELLGAKASRGQ